MRLPGMTQSASLGLEIEDSEAEIGVDGGMVMNTWCQEPDVAGNQ